MNEVIIDVISRTGGGKGVARKLRAVGKIPGVVYGRNEKPVAIEMDYAGFHNAMRKSAGENPIISLRIDGKESDKKALIRDIQRDPIDGKLLHIDFQHISLTEKIRVRVPVQLEGVPDGVKNFGGIVNWAVRDLEIFCLPTNIPEKFVLDIAPLKIHESLHVRDIKVENVEILESPDETVVTVVPPTIIKEAAPVAEGEVAAEAAAEPVEGEAAEPEVISEKKAEERKAEREKEKGKEK